MKKGQDTAAVRFKQMHNTVNQPQPGKVKLKYLHTECMKFSKKKFTKTTYVFSYTYVQNLM